MKMLKLDKAISWLKSNPYVALVVMAGLMLLLLPSGSNSKETQLSSAPDSAEIAVPGFSINEEQDRLCETLEKISGVGKVQVLLSLRSTVTRNLVDSEGEAIVVSVGSGKQQVVESGFEYPSYLGAVVVCQGAGDAYVRLNVAEAVAAFTGLGSNKIQVLKMD